MPNPPDRRATTGTTGEAHARRFLEGKGYEFIASNWFCQAGELDLIMLDDDELVFVEVKTRRGEAFGHAAAAVTWSKSRKVLKSAEWFVATHERFHEVIWRCDIVAINIDPRTGVASVQHEINALTWDG
jgi:putative endonuclease